MKFHTAKEMRDFIANNTCRGFTRTDALQWWRAALKLVLCSNSAERYGWFPKHGKQMRVRKKWKRSEQRWRRYCERLRARRGIVW